MKTQRKKEIVHSFLWTWKPNSCGLLLFSNEKYMDWTVYKRQRPIVHKEWEIYQPFRPKLKRSPEKRIKEEQRIPCDGRISVLKMKEASRTWYLVQCNSYCQKGSCWKVCKKQCREPLNMFYYFMRKIIQTLTKNLES